MIPRRARRWWQIKTCRHDWHLFTFVYTSYVECSKCGDRK